MKNDIQLRGLKVLKIDRWMEDTESRWFNETTSYSIYTKMEPILNRDGIYYDRINKMSWFESSGKAFLMDSLNRSRFLYVLNGHMLQILSNKEVANYRAIANKTSDKALKKQLLQKIHQNEYALLIQRGGTLEERKYKFRHLNSLKKFKEERNKDYGPLRKL